MAISTRSYPRSWLGAAAVVVSLSLALSFGLTRRIQHFVLDNHDLEQSSVNSTTGQQQQPHQQPQASSSAWNSKKPIGCNDWQGPMTRNEIHQQRLLQSPPPTGLSITLAKASSRNGNSDMQYHLVCKLVPTQQAYFLEPQGIDLLILIELEGYTMDMVRSCLNLTRLDDDNSDTPHTWQNLDGTNLTTFKFRSESGRGVVYLADNQMPYPEYIQQNQSILNDPKVGCGGNWPTDYVQGTRYYSGEVFQLGIMQEYDYWLKIDTDIRFNATVPFNMLHDMKIRGSLFAHTAEYPDGDQSCSTGARKAWEDYVDLARSPDGGDGRRPAWAVAADWKGPCSAGVQRFERAYDEYYSNFIIGSTKFWQSEPVRHFGKYLNEYFPGFFRYRWTDQVFFAMALGLFTGPDFQAYVADYTDLRCAPHPNCWFFWKANKENLPCANGGYFIHGKDARPWYGYASLNLTLPPNGLFRGDTPYQSKYVHQCASIEATIGS
jgi:hypothetical protein